ncbi:hypothetical protein G7K_5914-t1 [Saitoella complicata NRRL Y-17804]|uniref:Uncharacterized protein n=1 Tax=Saitoella complicata (strain BCRC 22490 / CBS 7301 / JCM 7358 / NBRC 10748 / NRRL Y-17804) TaxID=698492 RepID=A0A0E9NPT3_SAICN|nr:hypothetical protein G7K_5914-t1 [Saitoella complicata NRRL Y-17804]
MFASVAQQGSTPTMRQQNDTYGNDRLGKKLKRFSTSRAFIEISDVTSRWQIAVSLCTLKIYETLSMDGGSVRVVLHGNRLVYRIVYLVLRFPTQLRSAAERISALRGKSPNLNLAILVIFDLRKRRASHNLGSQFLGWPRMTFGEETTAELCHVYGMIWRKSCVYHAFTGLIFFDLIETCVYLLSLRDGWDEEHALSRQGSFILDLPRLSEFKLIGFMVYVRGRTRYEGCRALPAVIRIREIKVHLKGSRVMTKSCCPRVACLLPVYGYNPILTETSTKGIRDHGENVEMRR